MSWPRRDVAGLAAAAVVLFASFAFNALHVVTRDAFDGFQAESDALVANAVRAAAAGHDSAFGGFMVSVPDSAGRGGSLYHPLPGVVPDSAGRTAYVSQFGLQSVILSALAPRAPARVDTYLARTRIVSAALFAAVIIWAAILVLPAIGWPATALTLAMLACSPWLVLFARSLYWQPWALALPIVAVAAAYRPERRRALAVAAAVAFLTVLLRELIAYEYGTNIILGCGLAIVARAAAAGRRPRDVVQAALAVQIAAGAALAVAIAAHFAKLSALVGSRSAAVDAIRERIVARSYGAAANGFAYQTTGPFREFMRSHLPWCSMSCQNTAFMGRYFTLPAVAVPAVPMIFVPIGLVGLAALVVAAWPGSWRGADRELRAWRWTLAASAIWSASWAVAMPHHMLNHLHINAIIWYLPALPVAFAFLARAAAIAVSARRTA